MAGTPLNRKIAISLIPLVLVSLLSGCGDGSHSIPPYAVDGSRLPSVTSHPNSSVVMSWVENDGEGHRLRVASFRDGGWDEPVTVSRGDNWFVNWADFPSVRVIDDQLWAAHWLVRNGWNAYAYDVAVSISKDGGVSWSEPILPHSDATQTEHGFASLYPVDDSVGVVWLDGRETLSNTSGDQIVGMTLRSAVLNRDGQFQEALVDPLVCDCCQTDVALSSEGPVMVYRDRDQQEVRDIRLARHTQNGWAVAELIADDDWQVFGCPVNGPAIDASGDHVGVVWYTQGSGTPQVLFARSGDGGQTFTDPVLIDQANPMGRVDVVIDDSGCSLVSWIGRADGESADLRYSYVGLDNQPSEARRLTRIAATRPSGFPRIARSEKGALIAWTDISGTSSQVRTEEVQFVCQESVASR